LAKLLRISGPNHHLKKTLLETSVRDLPGERKKVEERKRDEKGRFEFYSFSGYKRREENVMQEMVKKLIRALPDVGGVWGEEEVGEGEDD